MRVIFIDPPAVDRVTGGGGHGPGSHLVLKEAVSRLRLLGAVHVAVGVGLIASA